jgi:hypothetical protein
MISLHCLSKSVSIKRKALPATFQTVEPPSVGLEGIALMTIPINCTKCGALTTMIICEYCGTLSREIPDQDYEKQALLQFHELLSRQPTDNLAKFIQNGFIPDQMPLLIDAGICIIPYINMQGREAVGSNDAITRLRTIIVKLKMFNESPVSRKAIQQFEGVIRHSERSGRLIYLSGLLVILIICILVPCLFLSVFAKQ